MVNLAGLLPTQPNAFCLAVHVLSSRVTWAEHLAQAFEAAWMNQFDFLVHSGTSNLRDNLFIFEFKKKDHMESVFCLALWSFDNQIMLLRVLKPGDQFSTLSFDTVDLWVQVMDLPFGWASLAICMTLENHLVLFRML